MSLTTTSTSNIFQREEIGKVRSAQEDSHDIAIFTPNGDVFVVCDGMGGHVGGKTASTIAVRSIMEYLKKEKYPEPLQALDEALQFANIQILGYADEHPELKGMGTTACIVLLQGAKAYIAHVGDSRIYLYLGKEKQLHRITKDHSYVQTLVDAGEITDEEAENHPNKNRILKALGIKGEVRPLLNTVQPKKGDIFLICSDGLSGMVTDIDMECILMQGESLERKGDELIDRALENGGLDNVTLELIQITTSPYSRSTFKSYNLPNRRQAPVYKIERKKWMVVALVMILLGILWNPIINIWIDYEKTEMKELCQEMDSIEKQVKQGIDSLIILSKKDKLADYNGKDSTTCRLMKELQEKYKHFKNVSSEMEANLKETKNLVGNCGLELEKLNDRAKVLDKKSKEKDDDKGNCKNDSISSKSTTLCDVSQKTKGKKSNNLKDIENFLWEYFLRREYVDNTDVSDLAYLANIGENERGDIISKIIGVGTKDEGLISKYKKMKEKSDRLQRRVNMLDKIKIIKE